MAPVISCPKSGRLPSMVFGVPAFVLQPVLSMSNHKVAWWSHFAAMGQDSAGGKSTQASPLHGSGFLAAWFPVNSVVATVFG